MQIQICRDLPNPDLVFDAQKHQYHLLSRPACHLESVTSFIHRHTPPFQAVYQATRRSRRDSRPLDAILAEWCQRGYQAASQGSRVHAYIESAINRLRDHGELPAPNSLPHLGPAAAWISSHPELAYGPLFSELRVADPIRHLAGSIDLFCHLDGVPTLVDFKTSATIDFVGYGCMLPPFSHLPNANGIHYALQLSMYARNLRDFHGIVPQQLVIVHIGTRMFTEMLVSDVLRR